MELICILLEVLKACSLSWQLFRGKFSYIHHRKNLRQVAPNRILFSERLRVIIDTLKKYPLWRSLAQVSREVFRKKYLGTLQTTGGPPVVLDRQCCMVYRLAPSLKYKKYLLDVTWLIQLTLKKILGFGAREYISDLTKSQHHRWTTGGFERPQIFFAKNLSRYLRQGEPNWILLQNVHNYS